MEIAEQLQKAQQAFEKGNYDYTLEVLEHLLSNSPASVEARHLLHLAKQKLIKNSSPIQQMINKVLTLASLITAKMIHLQNQKKQENWKIIDAYEKVLSTDPFNTMALTAISSLLVAEKNPQAAVQTLQEFLVVSPNYVPVLKQLAQLYLQLDQPKQARNCFEQILKITPKDGEAERSLKNLDAMDAIRGMKEETQNQ